MIKLSPMLDWRKAVEDLGKEYVEAVHIVSVDNECKELLLEVKRWKGEKVKELKVFCVNLLSDGCEERFEFDASSSRPSAHPFISSPFHFLYEPNASLMKAGCFGLIADRYQMAQPDVNSHLFVSDKEVADFPGRCFIVDKVTTMNKRELKEALAGITKANIAVLNFPMSVPELRRRLKLQEGGDVYIFATTAANRGHLLLLCRKKS